MCAGAKTCASNAASTAGAHFPPYSAGHCWDGRNHSKGLKSGDTALMKYDVFISYASEDKGDFVEPLARALKAAGVNVWYDNFVLEWGDALRGTIDRGLAESRYGIVVLSPAFLKRKRWTEHELDALFAREGSGSKVVLPIWHNITRENLAAYSPSFADRLAKNSATDSIDEIVIELKRLLAAPTDSASDSTQGTKKDWQEGIEAYGAMVVQVGGPESRLVTKTAWIMTGEHGYLDADRFVHVGFNGGGDIMSISPKEGYEIVRCSSPTGNRIIDDGYPKWRRIMLEEKLKNSLMIYCKKKVG